MKSSPRLRRMVGAIGRDWRTFDDPAPYLLVSVALLAGCVVLIAEGDLILGLVLLAGPAFGFYRAFRTVRHRRREQP